MNMAALIKRIGDIRVDIGNALGGGALINQMSTLTTLLEREKNTLQLNSVTAKATLLTKNFEEIEAWATAFDRKCRDELRSSIWKALQLEYKLLVDKEKEETWWFGWFRSRPIHSSFVLDSSNYRQLVSNKHDIEMSNHLRACAKKLVRGNDSPLVSNVDALLKVLDSPQSDPVSEVSVMLNKGLWHKALMTSCMRLIKFTKEKEEKLNVQFEPQFDIPEKALKLGLYKIPGYAEMSEEDRLRFETLYLQAMLPAMTSVKRKEYEPPAVSFSRTTSLGTSFSDDTIAAEQLVEISAKDNNIQGAGKVKKETLAEKMSALTQNLKLSTFGLFGLPSENETVKRLKEAAKHPMTCDALVAAKRRINRLKNYKNFKTVDFSSIEEAFEDAYQKNELLGIAKRFTRQSEQLEDEMLQSDRAALLQSYEVFSGEITSNERVILESNIPDKFADLQAFVYFILFQNASTETRLFLPVTWTQQDGLKMSSSTDDFALLLEGIKDLFIENGKNTQSSSFYYVVLVLSINLMRFDSTSVEYKVLRELLTAVFDGKYDTSIKATKNKLSKSLSWLHDYLPDTLKRAGEQLMVDKKELLLGENSQFFPLLQQKVFSNNTTRESRSTFHTPNRESVYDKAKALVVGSAKKYQSKAEEYDNILTDAEKFLRETQKIAGQIMRHKVDYSWIQENAEKIKQDFHTWVTIREVPPRIFLAYTMLEFYVAKRNQPGSKYFTDKNNYEGLEESIETCRGLMRQLVEYRDGKKTESSLSFEGFNFAFPVGVKLVDFLKKALPNRKISFSKNSSSDEALSLDFEEESDSGSVSSDEHNSNVYIDNLCVRAKQIDGKVAENTIRKFITIEEKRFPDANKLVLAAYILWKFFKEKSCYNELSSGLKTNYPKALGHFLQAMTRNEKVVPVAIDDFMKNNPADGHEELEALYLQTEALLRGGNPRMLYTPSRPSLSHLNGADEDVSSYIFPAGVGACNDANRDQQHNGFHLRGSSSFSSLVVDTSNSMLKIPERNSASSFAEQPASPNNEVDNIITARRSSSSPKIGALRYLGGMFSPARPVSGKYQAVGATSSERLSSIDEAPEKEKEVGVSVAEAINQMNNEECLEEARKKVEYIFDKKLSEAAIEKLSFMATPLLERYSDKPKSLVVLLCVLNVYKAQKKRLLVWSELEEFLDSKQNAVSLEITQINQQEFLSSQFKAVVKELLAPSGGYVSLHKASLFSEPTFTNNRNAFNTPEKPNGKGGYASVPGNVI